MSKPLIAHLAVDARWRSFLWLASLAFVISPGSLVGVAADLFWRAGEYLSIEEIVDEQERYGGLYRTVSIDAVMSPEQRLARYRRLAPEIVAVGSSRVLQFRASHFRRPFVNMGMSFDLVFFENLVRAMLRPPTNLKVVILSLDHWQFYPAPARRFVRNFDQPTLSGLARKLRDARTQYVAAPLNLIASGRLSLANMVALSCRCDPKSGLPNNNIGVAALIDGGGVDREGSYHYDWAFDRKTYTDSADQLQRIAHGTSGFEYADRVNEQRWQLLLNGIQLLKSHGIRVILIIPPMSGAVADKMERSGKYGIVSDLSKHLAELGYSFFDFHDSRKFGIPECEFADGMHGGEVTYLRMLSVMVRDRTSGLGEWVGSAQIDRLVDHFADHINAYEVPRSGHRERREPSAVNLGCR